MAMSMQKKKDVSSSTKKFLVTFNPIRRCTVNQLDIDAIWLIREEETRKSGEEEEEKKQQ